MLEVILKILAFAVSGALLFLLGHSLGKARGYGEGYHDATMFYKLLYGKERKPGEVVHYDAKTHKEIFPPGSGAEAELMEREGEFKRDPSWEIHAVGMNKEGKNNE